MQTSAGNFTPDGKFYWHSDRDTNTWNLVTVLTYLTDHGGEGHTIFPAFVPNGKPANPLQGLLSEYLDRCAAHAGVGGGGKGTFPCIVTAPPGGCRVIGEERLRDTTRKRRRLEFVSPASQTIWGALPPAKTVPQRRFRRHNQIMQVIAIAAMH